MEFLKTVASPFGVMHALLSKWQDTPMTPKYILIDAAQKLG
jgi:hypothetical protein